MLGFIPILTFSCATPPEFPTATAPALPTAEMVFAETNTPPPTPRDTPLPLQPILERPVYDLDASWEEEAHLLTVSEIVHYPNHTGETLEELVLVVEPLRISNTFDLLELRWTNSGGQRIADYELEDGLLRIQLPKLLKAEEQISLFLNYQLRLPASLDLFGYTARQSNFAYWYPFIPAFQDDWLVYPPSELGENHVNDSADFNVAITLDDGALTLAAPAPAEVSGNTYQYTLRGARGFLWSLGRDMKIFEVQYKEILVQVHVFPEHREAGEFALQVSLQSLELFEELYGEYPYEALVVVEMGHPDGLESDGLFYLGQNYFAEYNQSPRNYMTTLLPHEVAHQWFYGLVGSNQALEPWVDEAPAIYSELLYYQEYYPNLVDWWWEFRVDRFRPVGWVDYHIYQVSTFSAYVQAIYLRGAQFLHELRKLVGDEQFFNAYRTYLQDGKYQVMTADQFLAYFELEDDPKFPLLLEEYFLNTD